MNHKQKSQSRQTTLLSHLHKQLINQLNQDGVYQKSIKASVGATDSWTNAYWSNTSKSFVDNSQRGNV